ncbi:MAG: hypothetical protein QXJ06_05575 [Candidatus Aenigmatarchaeota archaeon]
MKKIIKFLTLVLIFFIGFFSANAQDYIDYVIKNQWYEVIYNEDGTATVNVVFNIFNKGFENKSLNTFKIQVSRGDIEILEIVQSSRQCKNFCVNYNQVCTGTEVVCNNFDKSSNQCLDWEERCKEYVSVCSEYEERCDSSEYQSDYRKDYKFLDKSQVKKSGNIYNIPIIPISSGDSSKLLIRYKLLNTVNKWLYNSFTFESLKVPVETEELRVAIKTDKDLHLKGTKSQIIFGSFGFFPSPNAAQVNSIDVKDKYYYYQIFDRIQYATGYVKERTNLDPGHTLIMKGKYSTNWFTLYLFEIVLFLTTTSGILFFWSKKLDQINKKYNQTLDAKKLKDMKDFHIWRAIGLSFVGIFFFILFLIISIFMTNSYLKSIVFSLAFVGLFGTLIFTKKIHSTREMFASIGFFFLWIIIIPFIIFLLYLSYIFITIFHY